MLDEKDQMLAEKEQENARLRKRLGGPSPAAVPAGAKNLAAQRGSFQLGSPTDVRMVSVSCMQCVQENAQSIRLECGSSSYAIMLTQEHVSSY